MPEYLAPGVFVEETSFRSKSIEGVATTTTGMIGPCAYGPVDLPSELLTSLADFERTYGAGNQLEFDGSLHHNYLWHAARAFFTEGGKRLYVVRTFRASSAPDYEYDITGLELDSVGYATGTLGTAPAALTVRARQTGSSSNGTAIRFTLEGGGNIFNPVQLTIPSGALMNDDVVLITTTAATPTVAPGFYRAISTGTSWEFSPRSGSPIVELTDLTADYQVSVVKVSVASIPTTGPTVSLAEALALVSGHTSAGALDSLLDVFAYDQNNPARNSDEPIVVTLVSPTATWADLLTALGATGNALPAPVSVTLSAGAAVVDGHARAVLDAGPTASHLVFLSRYPGRYGNFVVTLTVNLGQNVVGGDVGAHTFGSLRDRDVVLVVQRGTPPLPSTRTFCQARRDPATGGWRFLDSAGAVLFTQDAITTQEVRVVSLGISVAQSKGGAPLGAWSGLALDPDHQRDGASDSLLQRFTLDKDNPTKNRELPIIVSWTPVTGNTPAANMDILTALLDAVPALATILCPDVGPVASWSRDIALAGGIDGTRPVAADYEGNENAHTKTGLKQMLDLEEVSILAAPGATFNFVNGYRDNAKTIVNLLITHAQNTRAIAILDSGNKQSLTDVRDFRGTLDSSYAAFYYPWVMILDPITQVPIALPPSGFVAGIYARNDTNRAVYKAPANEVVNLALAFEQPINVGQQQVLNPEGINCFRSFEGRGNRLWGARTASSDPEWKYVNVRRYFLYLERSIDRGTQWAVFEPNGENLWANVRRTISDFLLNEWQSGALLGSSPEKAFFVKCDRSTMTQNDLDNGRLVCLIGVAALKPAEFVIFRIGQWTADRKV